MRRPEKIWRASDLDKEWDGRTASGQVNLEDPVEPVALTT